MVGSAGVVQIEPADYDNPLLAILGVDGIGNQVALQHGDVTAPTDDLAGSHIVIDRGDLDGRLAFAGGGNAFPAAIDREGHTQRQVVLARRFM